VGRGSLLCRRPLTVAGPPRRAASRSPALHRPARWWARDDVHLRLLRPGRLGRDLAAHLGDLGRERSLARLLRSMRPRARTRDRGSPRQRLVV